MLHGPVFDFNLASAVADVKKFGQIDVVGNGDSVQVDHQRTVVKSGKNQRIVEKKVDGFRKLKRQNMTSEILCLAVDKRLFLRILCRC